MTIKIQLEDLITQWDMNNTKFYQAWIKGELSEEALKSYAREYGSFISHLGRGWETIGDEKQGKVEDEHAQVWKDDFCVTLNTTVSEPEVEEVKRLMTTAEDMFSDEILALGSLYAFISQQSGTSRLKIDGLREYYDLGPKSETYFELHLDTSALTEKLLNKIQNLPEADQEKAFFACSEMARTVYQALDGMYEAHHQEQC